MKNNATATELRMQIVEVFLTNIKEFPELTVHEQLTVIDSYFNYITDGEIPPDEQTDEDDEPARRTDRTVTTTAAAAPEPEDIQNEL